MSDKNEIVKQMRSLIRTLQQHNHLYYVMGTNEIGDDEYDQLRLKLADLETKYPEYIQPDSPILTVGGTPDPVGDVKPHDVPMLSLGNIFNRDELKEFVDGIGAVKQDDNNPVAYVLENKFDGLAVSIIYKHGLLTQALTRGDGIVGEDVTTKVKTIHNIPKYLEEALEIPVLEVRGEVIMTKAGFLKYNEEAITNGTKTFSNTRNAAAGSLRQKNTDKPRPLAFYAYSINQGRPEDIDTQTKVFLWLVDMGFSVGDIVFAYTVGNIQRHYESLIKHRDNLPYDIDGMVIKVNNLALQETLGYKTREPKWAMAYKFPAKTVLTKLEGVTWQVGRVGQITPVGHLPAVEIGGVIVSNVTLHNVAELDRLGIKIGDTVTLERAGDVIPKITKVWNELRDGSENDIVIPKTCPCCSVPLQHISGEATLFCMGGLECEAQLLGSLVHFTSRECMDIDGLAEGTIVKLLDKGIIDTPDSIYDLEFKRDKLSQLEGFGSKSIEKLLTSIDNSRTTTLQRFIYSLGIRNVGVGTSTRLAKHYGTLESFIKASHESLLTIPDIGPITAEQVHQFITTENNIKVIFGLLDKGVVVEPLKQVDISNLPMAGETWVITGKFDKTRDELKAELEALGATVSNTVNSKTKYLLSDGVNSSKYKKALRLGVTIVSSF